MLLAAWACFFGPVVAAEVEVDDEGLFVDFDGTAAVLELLLLFVVPPGGRSWVWRCGEMDDVYEPPPSVGV